MPGNNLQLKATEHASRNDARSSQSPLVHLRPQSVLICLLAHTSKALCCGVGYQMYEVPGFRWSRTVVSGVFLSLSVLSCLEIGR